MSIGLSSQPGHDRILDPVAACLTPDVARRIVGLRLDPVVQSRVDELAIKANEGELTPDERAEYEEIIEKTDLLGILKSLSRRVLAQ
jgi:hypothetical protein